MSERRRRRRRIVLWSLVPIALAAAFTALMLRDAFSVARTLQTAANQVLDARSALADGDLETGDSLLAQARGGLAESQELINRPLWRAFERIPVLGRTLYTARALNNTADEAARVGRRLVDQSGVVIDDDGKLKITITDGQLSLPALADAAAAIEAVDLESFRASLARLEATPATWIPEEVRDARRDALELGREALRTIDSAAVTLQVMQTFAGGDGPRRYFLAMQNPAELRGTGGLIGFFSILTAVDGRFEISDPETYDVIERPGSLGTGDRAPLRNDEFDGRYGSADARGFVANVNLDGDLPTVGPVLTELAERQLGIELDGAVLIDPIGLSRALQRIGPVTVPNAFVDPTGQIPNPLPPDRLPDVTLKEAYEVFGGFSEQRDDYLRELATAAFELLFSGNWDPIPVSQDIAAAALTRHLQLWSESPTEQGAFEALDVAGALVDPSGADFLAVTGVNAAANKLDIYTPRSVNVDVRFDGNDLNARRIAAIEVGLANEAPANRLNSYVAGSGAFDPDQRFADRDGPHGLNRTWLTVWAPPDSSVLRVETPEGQLVAPIITPLEKVTAVDRSVTLMPDEAGGFRTRTVAPARLRRDGPDLVYSFTLRRQPMALADAVQLTIRPPDDWSVSEVEAVQSADAILESARGELAVEVTDDLVTIAGHVDADVQVTVRFSRTLSERFQNWLSELP